MFVFQVSRLVQNSILYSTFSVPRLTHPTLRRSPWLTWWGSLWSYSLAAIGQQVSNILILNAFPFIIISFKNLSGLVTMWAMTIQSLSWGRSTPPLLYGTSYRGTYWLPTQGRWFSNNDGFFSWLLFIPGLLSSRLIGTTQLKMQRMCHPKWTQIRCHLKILSPWMVHLSQGMDCPAPVWGWKLINLGNT